MRTNFLIPLASAAIGLMLLAGCQTAPDTPLKELVGVYAEIQQNEQDMADAFQAVYKAPRDEQEALMEKAKATAEQTKQKNELLVQKAVQLADALRGTEFVCEATAASGYTVTKCVFYVVDAQPTMANIVMRTHCSQTATEKPYILLVDEAGQTVLKSPGTLAGDSVSLNFRITRKSDFSRLASAAKLVVVSQAEYQAGSLSPKGSDPAPATDAQASEPEPSEPEPAYEGNASDGASGESVTVGGVTLTKGANLVQTLRKCSNISWGYNADFGLTATIGDVWLVIDEADLTQAGIDAINAITSDMADDIDFSIDYIKPSAKVGDIER